MRSPSIRPTGRAPRRLLHAHPQLFITASLLLHYVCKCRQLHIEIFIARKRTNEDTKQKTLSRPETTQPLSKNHKRGGQVRGKRTEYTDTWRDIVVVSRGGKTLERVPTGRCRQSNSRFNRFTCKIRRLDLRSLFSDRLTNVFAVLHSVKKVPEIGQ